MKDLATYHAFKPLAYKVQAASEVSGLSRSKIFVLMKEGKLQTLKVGKARLVLASSLESFLIEAAAQN